MRGEAGLDREVFHGQIVEIEVARGRGIDALCRLGAAVSVEGELRDGDVADAFQPEHRDVGRPGEAQHAARARAEQIHVRFRDDLRGDVVRAGREENRVAGGGAVDGVVDGGGVVDAVVGDRAEGADVDDIAERGNRREEYDQTECPEPSHGDSSHGARAIVQSRRGNIIRRSVE